MVSVNHCVDGSLERFDTEKADFESQGSAPTYHVSGVSRSYFYPLTSANQTHQVQQMTLTLTCQGSCVPVNIMKQ